MARKYTRDNRGRFASGGGGATARGGRLKTASGNKRKTQTMKAAGAGGAGVMKGAVKRDPGAMGKVGKAKPAPKLDLSGAAMNRRWERADAKREAALNKGDRFQFQRQLAVQRTYMTAKRATNGDPAAARELYASQPKYSTIKNPKNPRKAAKPAEGRGRSLKPGEAIPKRTQAQAAKGVATTRKAKALLAEKGGRTAPIGSKLSNAYSRAVVAETGNTNRLRALQMRAVNAAMKGAKIKVKPVTIDYSRRR
jgi:hypothetical protein